MDSESKIVLVPIVILLIAALIIDWKMTLVFAGIALVLLLVLAAGGGLK